MTPVSPATAWRCGTPPDAGAAAGCRSPARWGVATTISPSTMQPAGRQTARAACSSGKKRSRGRRSRLWMTTRRPTRKTSARKPSHFGSKMKSSPCGRASETLASMGSIGAVKSMLVARPMVARWQAARHGRRQRGSWLKGKPGRALSALPRGSGASSRGGQQKRSRRCTRSATSRRQSDRTPAPSAGAAR